jgi:hypothetical protein
MNRWRRLSHVLARALRGAQPQLWERTHDRVAQHSRDAAAAARVLK